MFFDAFKLEFSLFRENVKLFLKFNTFGGELSSFNSYSGH